jgi:hypothetical protein
VTYKSVLAGFKSLFPKYVLSNEHIQKSIERMSYSQSSIAVNFNKEVPDQGLIDESMNLPTIVNPSEIE